MCSDAVVKAMARRSGAEVAQRGSDKHLHYARGVTVEEMRQASIALMQLVPTESVVRQRPAASGKREVLAARVDVSELGSGPATAAGRRQRGGELAVMHRACTVYACGGGDVQRSSFAVGALELGRAPRRHHRGWIRVPHAGRATDQSAASATRCKRAPPFAIAARRVRRATRARVGPRGSYDRRAELARVHAAADVPLALPAATAAARRRHREPARRAPGSCHAGPRRARP